MNKYKNIIQFSPIRTGSTFVYNIIKTIFKNKNIKKTHKLNYKANNLYIITIRHPYNSIISSILRYSDNIDIQTLKKHINEYLTNGGTCIANNNLNKRNIIVFYYEDFFNNIDNIFNKIENRLKIKINVQIKDKLKSITNIDNVIKLTSKYENFSKYDKNTHYHGNHISQNKGETDYNNYLNIEQTNLLKKNKYLNNIINIYYNN